MIGNLQFFYDCRDAVTKDSDEDGITAGDQSLDSRSYSDEDDLGIGEDDTHSNSNLNEDTLQALLLQKENTREAQHGRAAISIAQSLGVFSRTPRDDIIFETGASKFQSKDIEAMKSWKKAIQKTKQPVESYEETVDTEDAGGVSKINTLLEDRKDEGKMTYMGDVLTKEANKEVDDSCLKPDQHRAYSIIISHLRAELQGQKPTQLLMLLTGEGGTGKSKVIQMVTETFDDLGAHSQLLKGAYTGIAACTIGGTTLHSLCGVPVKGKQPSTTTLNKLILMWQNVRYLIIDEYSMISRSFLTRISSTLSLVMDRVRGYAEDLAFGGLNVIISGDFHQFPPVCSRKSAPLYWRPSTDDTNEESMGSELYLKFNKVVILKDQVRVTDEGWLDLL